MAKIIIDGKIVYDDSKENKQSFEAMKTKKNISKIPDRMRIKNWQETMTEEEIRFIWNVFRKIEAPDETGEFPYGQCIDNHRAARFWISSQRRRYFRDRANGCCEFFDTVVQRCNPEKNRFDKYMIGFNYGH